MQLEKQRKRKIQERQTTGIERGMREEEKGIEGGEKKKGRGRKGRGIPQGDW